MPARITEETVKSWLADNCPQLRLLKYGGSASANSFFFSDEYSREFQYTFTDLKKLVRAGKRVGIGRSRTMAQVNKARRITEDDVANWLQANAPHIALLSWGGSADVISVFSDAGRTFEYSFSNVKSNIRQGYQKVGCGIGSNQSYTELQAAQEWLKIASPDITITTWGGNASSLSSFYNSRTDHAFSMRFSALKHSIKTGAKKVGTGTKFQSLTDAQQQLDALSPGRFTLVQYNGTDRDKSVYTKNVTGEQFSYYHTSLTTSLTLDPSFDPLSARSSLEVICSKLLDDLGVSYSANQQLEDSKYRPDFVLPEYKVIVECDGLYWHSDRIRDKNYHKNKLAEYESLGYRALFFHEDELRHKAHIVRSVIKNALQQIPVRVFARKCTIANIDPDFFSDNHLMGKGVGRCFGLFYQDTLVAGIQVKWRSKSTKDLEIARFCPLVDTTVVGGFSRLVKHVELLYTPSSITTFIDRRYGTGTSLASLGFVHKGTHLSFTWVKGLSKLHRMKFPGNKGYEQGFYKLWDCGQAKWVKVI